MNDAPIGIIDSGLGGLTIWVSIRKLLPNESTHYIADHAWVPYSGKSRPVIRQRVKSLIANLLEKSCKLVVIACNTATVAGIDQYRKWFPNVPIIGVVPVIKTAAQVSKTRMFAVLSTTHTAKSEYQKRLTLQFAGDCHVLSIGCPQLVEFVESGRTKGVLVRTVLSEILSPLDPRVDTIVLGCTHFPFLVPEIRAIVGEGVAVLDSGGAVARQVGRVLEARGEIARKSRKTHVFYTTGNSEKVSRVATKLMGTPMTFLYAKL